MWSQPSTKAETFSGAVGDFCCGSGLAVGPSAKCWTNGAGEAAGTTSPVVRRGFAGGGAESDPVGATWGSGVRRAPQTTTWGWNQATVAKTMTPTLMVAGIHDKQVPPDRVRQLYTDLGAPQKMLIDLGCSSHNAMWEKNHLVLFRASREWLESGTVNGAKDGVLRLGY